MYSSEIHHNSQTMHSVLSTLFWKHSSLQCRAWHLFSRRGRTSGSYRCSATNKSLQQRSLRVTLHLKKIQVSVVMHYSLLDSSARAQNHLCPSHASFHSAPFPRFNFILLPCQLSAVQHALFQSCVTAREVFSQRSKPRLREVLFECDVLTARGGHLTS